MILNLTTLMHLSSMLVYVLNMLTKVMQSHHICPGLPAERCLHSHPGSTGEHSARLLEDDMGLQMWLYYDVVSAARRWAGQHTTETNSNVYVYIWWSVGEQPLLLAKEEGRGDGVW